jgi:hypothetical protein
MPLPERDSQYTHKSWATEIREIRLREGPVVTRIVLTVFTQNRYLCFASQEAAS